MVGRRHRPRRSHWRLCRAQAALRHPHSRLCAQEAALAPRVLVGFDRWAVLAGDGNEGGNQDRGTSTHYRMPSLSFFFSFIIILLNQKCTTAF